MSIPLVVYFFSCTYSVTHASATPLFEQARVTLSQMISMITQAQLPFNFLVVLGVVSLWRGAWGLMDLHIFPKNMSLSYLFSLALGLIILLSTYDLAKQYL